VQLKRHAAAALALFVSLPACTSKDAAPSNPGAASASVRFVLRGLTTRDPNLPRSADTCARFVGPTHLHPSWRNFDSLTMNAVGSDRYELTLEGVPTGTRLSVQVADQNACVDDDAGWVTKNFFANDVALTQVITVNAGKGFGLTVAANGSVTP